MSTTEDGQAGDAPGAEHYRRQLDALAQNATLALFIMDERQRCTYMNPAAEQLTGYTLAEVQGKALHDYIHHTRPDGTPYPLEECPIDRAFPQRMREQGEEVFVHKDGHFYPVAFTASPIRDGERTVGTIIEARDITEERRARRERRLLLQELETERNRLRTVFQQSPAFIALITGEDHVFELANPPYQQLVGRRDIVGRPVREALPEVVEQGFVQLLDGVFRTGEPFIGTEVPIALQREAGSAPETRFLNFVYQPLPGPDGRTTGILAHGVDVTELVESRRRAQEYSAQLESQTEELRLQAQHMEDVQIELEASNEQLQLASEEAARERRRLQSERSRLREMFMQAPAMIAVLRGPQHVVELANPPYLAALGRSDVVGKPLGHVVPEMVGQGYIELLDRVYASGEPVVGNESVVLFDRRGDGEMDEGFYNFVFQPLREEGRVGGILIHAVDVTTQVRARESVERLEERLRLALDAADVGTYDWDVAAGTLNWDPRARRIFGVAPGSEVTYDTFLEIVDAADRERAAGAVGAALDPGGKGEFASDYRVATADGEPRWVRAVGRVYFEGEGAARKPVRFLGTVQDITERRMAEAERERLIAELETGQARLRQIFTQAPAVMALYSGPEHVITLVNPTWEETVGKPGAVGRPFRQVFPEFAGTGLFETLDRIYETGEPFVDAEVNVPLERFGSGVTEDTWWNLVWRPLAGGGQQGRDILVHAVEVTAQVRARREIEAKADELGRLARQLEASNRELDQFAYVASHDLKAPLRGISNLSSWIEEDLGDRVTDEAREHLALLRGRVHRMEGLIDGILQYSRAGKVREQPEPVDVNELLDEVKDLLALPDGFSVRVPEPLPRLVTERLPLQQVLMNLLGNAAKYNTSPAPWVQVTARNTGAAYEFVVADNGPGIAPEYHERIFGIFQTLQARDKLEGTGIGLSLVQKLVESRGGRIWVDSAPGAGAAFRFTWPTRGDDA